MAPKAVLITGANRGIGLAFAEHYIKAGCKVIGTARSPDSADKLKALAPYKIVQLDSSDEASILKAVKELEGEPIDLLINNAGMLDRTGLHSTTKTQLMNHFEVNTVGPFLITHALLPNLKLAADAGGSATMAQISSLVGSISWHTGAIGVYDASGTIKHGNHYAYGSSKAAGNLLSACHRVTTGQHHCGGVASRLRGD